MTEELKLLEDWFRANELSLNAKQTTYILFKKKKKKHGAKWQTF